MLQVERLKHNVGSLSFLIGPSIQRTLLNHLSVKNKKSFQTFSMRNNGDILSRSQLNSFTSRTFDLFQREYNNLWQINPHNALVWVLRYLSFFVHTHAGASTFVHAKAPLYLRRCSLSQRYTYCVFDLEEIIDFSTLISTKTYS